MSDPTPERYWQGEAARLARSINMGWWADRFNRIAATIFLFFALGVIAWRTFRPESVSASWIGLGMAIGVAVAALAALAWSHRRWIGMREGLIRLDSRLSLDNALVAAARGRGSWPSPTIRDSTESARPRWRWLIALAPGLGAIALVALAVWIPVPTPNAKSAPVAAEPGAWERMEDWVETLAEEELIDPEADREYRERIEQLRERDREEWFSDSSLEATDTLEENLGQEIKEMAQSMSDLERDLESLQSSATSGDPSTRKEAEEAARESLEKLAGNDLSRQSELVEGMKKALSQEGGEDGGLSREQIESLRQQLREGSEALGEMQGLPPLESLPESMMAGSRPGTMPGPGQGEVQRGPGDAPLHFGEENQVEGGKLEGVSGDTADEIRLGDLIGVGETEHDEDAGAEGSRAGGAIAGSGRGGEAVFRESFLPDEQSVLKRYFGEEE